MSIQAITRVIPPILEEASSVTNGSDSISTTQNVVESATSSNTQATSQKASRVRRCWDRMTAVFCCNTSRADVALSNNVSIENVALIGSVVQNKTERLASDLVNLQDRVSLASGSDSISTTQDVVASATASVTNGSDSISTTQNVVESATSSNTQATSQKASRVRRCWDRMTAVLCCNTSRADVALSNNVSIENVALIGSAVQNKTERLASDLVNLQDRVSLASGSDSISTTQDSDSISTTQDSDSISTTQDVVASATASVTNGSDIRDLVKIQGLVSLDLVKIQGLVSLAFGLKESNLHSQNTISEYVRLNPIGCMSVPEAEQFADYILKISQSNIDSTKKTVYLKRLLEPQNILLLCQSLI